MYESELDELYGELRVAVLNALTCTLGLAGVLGIVYVTFGLIVPDFGILPTLGTILTVAIGAVFGSMMTAHNAVKTMRLIGDYEARKFRSKIGRSSNHRDQNLAAWRGILKADEEFFVLRAKCPYAVRALSFYSDLLRRYGDPGGAETAKDFADQMYHWRQRHGEPVKA